MFFEVALGIKSIVVMISLIGLFFGLFPELPKTSKHAAAVVVAAPVIDNPWAAFVAAPDAAARLNIETAVKEMETTTRLADDNAARVALYAAHQTTARNTLKYTNRLLVWGLVGLVGLAFPLPKRSTQKQEVQIYE